MDKFKQLESFVAVAALGSLSAAARAQDIAPTMMSRRLDALEARLGVKLFVRSTRRLSLTSEGALFLEEAQRILRDLAEAEAQVAQGGTRPSGPLRISAPAGFGRRHIAPLLPDFLQRYPDISITLDLSDRLVDLIDERYDCAIRIGDLDNSQYVGIRLADNRRVIVASPDYLNRFGRPNTPDDLVNHNCLSFGTQGNQSRGWLLKQEGHVKAYRVKGTMSSSDGSVLHAWALAGCGLAWRSLWEVRQDIDEGRLVTVLDEFAAPPNGIFALMPERRHIPPRLQVFTDMLKVTYAQTSYWDSH
ncbi:MULTISPECIES: LysR family transcriptional regulator [unclassified Pusillimonas]|uniref:LysR family transcriptional regulator n=1 Tax=unclassified Pusillimonas TaxID=2640016 RepID=UPI000B9CF743|nr:MULTISPECIES: LysR family transcriptional regulator [unclassified Pusillimonas]OXR49615.1 LysR family transcriptional regulator [Pusillimonas sp. T2]ROT44949.1 LysR family transcriptional regulator [Pusillimonas sp. NJUB218]